MTQTMQIGRLLTAYEATADSVASSRIGLRSGDMDTPTTMTATTTGIAFAPLRMPMTVADTEAATCGQVGMSPRKTIRIDNDGRGPLRTGMRRRRQVREMSTCPAYNTCQRSRPGTTVEPPSSLRYTIRASSVCTTVIEAVPLQTRICTLRACVLEETEASDMGRPY